MTKTALQLPNWSITALCIASLSLRGVPSLYVWDSSQFEENCPPIQEREGTDDRDNKRSANTSRLAADRIK
jgi:hypothetical protein